MEYTHDIPVSTTQDAIDAGVVIQCEWCQEILEDQDEIDFYKSFNYCWTCEKRHYEAMEDAEREDLE